MANLIVGDTGCLYEDVAKILDESETCNENPKVKWYEIAMFMKVPQDELIQIRNQLNVESPSFSTAYMKILQLWRQDNSNNGTLLELISVLDYLHYQGAIDKLRHDFGVSDDFDIKSYRKTKSGRQKYVQLPKHLEEFLNGPEFLMVMCTLEEEITIQKLKQNLKTKWKLISEGEVFDCQDSKAMLTVIRCVSSLLDLLPKLGQLNCRNKFLLVTTQNKEEVNKTLKDWKADFSRKWTFDKISWADLSENFQNEVIQRKIQFQSKQIIANNFFEGKSLTELDTMLTGHFLISLIKDQAPELIKAAISEELKYYIPRNILPRHIFKLDILNQLENTQDVFVCTGVEAHVFSKLVKIYISDTSTNQLAKQSLTVKHIKLDAKKDFEKICNKTDNHIHWLHYENEMLRWIQSRGSTKLLREIKSTELEQNNIRTLNATIVL